MMRILGMLASMAFFWGASTGQTGVLWAQDRPHDTKKASLQKESPASIALRMMEEVKKREAELARKETELREREERLKVLSQELEAAARDLDRKRDEFTRMMEQQEKEVAGTDQDGVLRLAKLIDSSPPEQGAKILSSLDPKVAARVLSAMNQRKAGRFLANLPPEAAVKIGQAMLAQGK